MASKTKAQLSLSVIDSIKALAEAMAKDILAQAATKAKTAKEPEPAFKKRRALLKNWRVVNGLYGNSGGLNAKLTGQVYGHPSFRDGQVVTTSPLLRLDITERVAETIHTVYVLG